MSSKRLNASHVDAGKKWTIHLTNNDHKALVVALFIGVNVKRDVEVLKQYHNKYLRLDARDSVSLKNFVGLNDAQYFPLNRSLFYFYGVRICAPVNQTYLLQTQTILVYYTTLTSR